MKDNKKPIKFLFVSANLNETGGIQAYTKKAMETIRSFGNEVETCQLPGLSKVNKLKFILTFIVKVVTYHPDIIYCAHISFAPLCFFAQFIFRSRYVVAIYGIEVENPSKVERLAFQNTDGITYLFERTRENAQRVLNGKTKVFFNIPNSVDTKHFLPQERKAALVNKFNAEGKKIVYSFCRLSLTERDNKGYEKVLRAFAGVHSCVSNSIFVMAGGGDDLNAMKDLSKQLGVEKHVFFPGALSEEEKLDYYNLCDVFVYPSKREGFPAIVLLEALACGKPIVVGNQAGSETFQNTFGLIVDPDNSEKLSDAITDVLTGDAEYYYRTPTAIHEEIEKRYGEDAYRNMISSFLSNCKNILLKK